MSDDTDTMAGDGGSDAPTDTFESVEWDDIDITNEGRTWGEKLWIVIVSVWTLGVLFEIYSRFVAGTGQAVYPFIGEIASEDYLWAFALACLVFYGIRPLYKSPRMTMHYWKQFRKNKAAVISGLFLIVIFTIGVVGSRVLPDASRNPGYERLPPFWMSIEDYVTGNNCPGGTTVEDGVTMCHGSMDHPLGTTSSGEDILLLSIHGMEVSMMVGITATFISIAIATLVGLTAAYYGGLLDEILMRYVDIQMTFPTFFLYLLLAYTIGGSLFILIMIFGLFGWGATARIIRAEALQRREEPYMMAAKSSGATSRWSIRRHLLPNTTNSVITAATLAIPGIILTEAAISFLGLADASIPSWGRVIANGQDYLRSAWWISTFPGFFLFFTILAFNFIGDALRDALDPRHGGSD
ncbi:ABC transporter permease [Halovivax gelatinilyticus]|uniref:ABC transporter permease n=1 Tax=Halovivax gelatinilyticus TaxID=2961597 RepID=UPI0020CA5FD5|nr:ABC transporter permease [Halovivax gelatinilyticus]